MNTKLSLLLDSDSLSRRLNLYRARIAHFVIVSYLLCCIVFLFFLNWFLISNSIISRNTLTIKTKHCVNYFCLFEVCCLWNLLLKTILLHNILFFFEKVTLTLVLYVLPILDSSSTVQTVYSFANKLQISGFWVFSSFPMLWLYQAFLKY